MKIERDNILLYKDKPDKYDKIKKILLTKVKYKGKEYSYKRIWLDYYKFEGNDLKLEYDEKNDVMVVKIS